VKIIIVGPAYPWRGGIAHHSALLAEHLAKRHEVVLVTFTRQYPSIRFPGRTQYETGGNPPSILPVQRIDSINPLTWIRTGLELRREAPALLVFAHSIPFFGPSFGTIAAIARTKAGIRTVFLCHNVVPHEKRPGDTVLTKYAFSFADHFIVQSEAVRKDLLRLKPGASHTLVHHPVYEAFGQPVPKDEARKALDIRSARTLLFFGYVRRYKGLTVLLRALRLVPDVYLVVAGEFYENEETFRQHAMELGIADRVRFVNSYIPKEEVPLYFSAADAVVVPYISATQSGVVQLAYNFNRPVIATDVGGLSEVVIDGVTGRIVPPGDDHAMGKAIRDFYEKNEEPRMAGEVAKVKADFSWDKLVAALESFPER
jgi:glycosyltransferase involved in cell wall biosynthesis